MKWILVLVLMMAAISDPTAAWAGWRGTEWGISPDQVEAATPGVTRMRVPSTENKQTARNRGPITLGDLKLTATYFYNEQGLSSAEVKVRPKDCRPAFDAILKQYGQPVVLMDQVILQVTIWHDEPNTTRVRLLSSPSGIYVFYFENLATYREYDRTARLKAGSVGGR